MKNYWKKNFKRRLKKHLKNLIWDKPEDVKNDLIDKIMEDWTK